MKLPSTLFLLLVFLVALPACGGSKKSTAKPADERMVSGGPAAADKPVKARIFVDPTAAQTLYLAYLRDANDKPVSGVSVQLLVQRPEGLYINEPRRKTVAYGAISGLDGIAPMMIDSDNKPKFVWVGGLGVQPVAYEVGAAVGGSRIKIRCDVTVVPIAHLIIEDASGMRVPNGIITFKPIGGEVNNRGLSDNYGKTGRTNGFGEIKFTRPAGRYGLIATKERNTCRLYQIVDWDGDGSKPLTFKLPTKSMTEQPW
jgi:hypothetical protein